MPILLGLLLWILGGCVVGPAPYLPADWISHPVEITEVRYQPVEPRLQVFIMYSGLETSHSALRLIAPTGRIIFWDPGGDYGRFDDDWYAQYGPFPDGVQRDDDLIVSNPPDVETFIQWRWTLDDTSVEVFEWELSDSYAERLGEILLHGTDDTHPAGSFSTWTYPMFCTMATSDFLKRFASPLIKLPEQYFFPDQLAKALYTQSPSRVRVFTWDGSTAVYSPPGPRSVRQ